MSERSSAQEPSESSDAPVGASPRRFLRLRAPRRPQADASTGVSRWFFAAFVFTAAVLGTLLAGLNSSLLDIQTVEVEGAQTLSAASVRQLAGLRGEHVILADYDAAQARIAALPMVKAVSIQRNWPNGATVVIVEREAWGRWRANSTVWAIDSDGVVLEGAPPTDNGPIVTQVSALPAVRAGARVDLSAIQMTAELHRRGSPVPLPGILAYEWSLADGLVVVTEHGRIVFGGGGLSYKYAVWESLERIALSRGEPLLFADLRFGLRPRVEIGLDSGRGIRNRAAAANPSMNNPAASATQISSR